MMKKLLLSVGLCLVAFSLSGCFITITDPSASDTTNSTFSSTSSTLEESTMPTTKTITTTSAAETTTVSPVKTIGDTVSLDGFEVTLVKASVQKSIKTAAGLNYNSQDGKSFLILFFDSLNTNGGTENTPGIGAILASVDGIQTTTEAVLGKLEDCMPLIGATSPNSIFKGYIALSVPDDWQNLSLSFISNGYSGKESEAFKLQSCDLR
ncbi:MAG: hypothetical protein MJZ76_06435 [Bacteroidales bacterium]|nr:hypothetical protein [Bacteroidales bacterium]